MALYLVQHGQALSKDQDPEQPLSEKGKADVQRIADVASGYSVKVGSIEHSGKARARQTAKIFADVLSPAGGVHERVGIKPMDDVTVIANDLNPNADLMLVGHLPFMEKLASYLIIGQLEPLVMKFQNGGIVCLDQAPESNGWFIKWTLSPNVG